MKMGIYAPVLPIKKKLSLETLIIMSRTMIGPYAERQGFLKQ